MEHRKARCICAFFVALFLKKNNRETAACSPGPSFALKCRPPPAGEKMFLELSPLSASAFASVRRRDWRGGSIFCCSSSSSSSSWAVVVWHSHRHSHFRTTHLVLCCFFSWGEIVFGGFRNPTLLEEEEEAVRKTDESSSSDS